MLFRSKVTTSAQDLAGNALALVYNHDMGFEYSDYTDHGDETITDESSGLMWEKGQVSNKNQNDASDYCYDSMHAGYNDWRLPTKDELLAIVDKDFSPTIDSNYFSSTQYATYWTSTQDGARFWSVNFGNGLEQSRNYYDSGNVRCVRKAIAPYVIETSPEDEE